MFKRTIPILMAIILVIAIPGWAQQPAPEKITQGPVVEGVGDSWAVIAWTTNTGGSTVVRYGTNPNHLDQTAESAYSDNEKSSAQNHRVHLKNLKPGTTYYFMVVSGQGEGTGTQAGSSVGQFTTKGSGKSQSPGEAGEKAMAVKIIDGPRVEGVGANWAVIAWTTNTGSNSVVHYGTNTNSLNETAEAPYADNEKSSSQTHRVRLNNLKTNTTYFFVADSGQGEGTGTESKSSVGQFTTKAH
jgi:phosphodiesterase/alkaline phosphatase D-like protein